jgi:hypothetical protein
MIGLLLRTEAALRVLAAQFKSAPVANGLGLERCHAGVS